MKTKLLLLFILFCTLTQVKAEDPGDRVHDVSISVMAMFRTIQVSLRSYSDKDIMCSGTISAWTQNNRFQTYHYSRVINARNSDFHTYYLNDYRDQFRNANHFITCYER